MQENKEIWVLATVIPSLYSPYYSLFSACDNFPILGVLYLINTFYIIKYM